MNKGKWIFRFENKWWGIKSFDIYLIPTVHVWWVVSDYDLVEHKYCEKDFGLHLYFLGFLVGVEYEWDNYPRPREGIITTTNDDGTITWCDMKTGEYITNRQTNIFDKSENGGTTSY